MGYMFVFSQISMHVVITRMEPCRLRLCAVGQHVSGYGGVLGGLLIVLNVTALKLSWER